MMDFFQVSPEFSKSYRKYFTRINEKKTTKWRSELEHNEETLLVET